MKRGGPRPKGRQVKCGLCTHAISLDGARNDPTHGWVCRDGKGCKRRRR